MFPDALNHALVTIERAGTAQAPVNQMTRTERAAFLALAVLSERDLHTPQGHDYIAAHRVARVLGCSPDTALAALRSLAGKGRLVMVTNRPRRSYLQGPEALQRIPLRLICGFRLPEEAFT